MKIIILRHGQAIFQNIDRVLSSHGMREVADTSSQMARLYKLTKCISSPKTRAVQTATIACNQFNFRQDLDYLKDLAPSGDPDTVIAYVDAVCQKDDVVLLVSHLPLVENLAYHFVNKQKSPPEFETACALILDYDGQKGKFEKFFTPFDDYQDL